MANELKSTVELYRSGEILEIPYDLSDPLERAIWSGLQLYVDHLERRAILAAEEFDRPEVWAALHPYVDHPDSEAYLALLGSRRAWELEEYLKDLREAMHGDGPMDSVELYDAARRVLEIIFASEEAGGYSVSREFWEASDEEAPESAPQRAETPVRLAPTLMPLAGMLRAALGEHVPLAEAAQRLSLSPQAVESRIAEGRLRAIPVNGGFLVSAADLPEG
jgi:hypothetical protein